MQSYSEFPANMAVFPGLQGEPHSHAVGGIAVANARRLAACLIKLGFKVVTGGTDIHLVLVDMRKSESVFISGNKNTGPRDKPSLITRDLENHDVVEFLHERPPRQTHVPQQIHSLRDCHQHSPIPQSGTREERPNG